MKAGRHPGRPRARLQPQSGVRGRARPQRCGPGRRKAGAEARKAPRPLHLPPLRQSRPRTRSGTDTDREPAAPPRTQLPSSTPPRHHPGLYQSQRARPEAGPLIGHDPRPSLPPVKAPQPICLPPSSPAFQAKSSAATEAGEQRGADFECSRGRLAANGEGRAGGRRGGDRLAGR